MNDVRNQCPEQVQDCGFNCATCLYKLSGGKPKDHRSANLLYNFVCHQLGTHCGHSKDNTSLWVLEYNALVNKEWIMGFLASTSYLYINVLT